MEFNFEDRLYWFCTNFPTWAVSGWNFAMGDGGRTKWTNCEVMNFKDGETETYPNRKGDYLHEEGERSPENWREKTLHESNVQYRRKEEAVEHFTLKP